MTTTNNTTVNTVAERISALFPLKGVITQRNMNEADMIDTRDCLGARTFKDALGDNIHILERISDVQWGNASGYITCLRDDKGNPLVMLEITTVEKIGFMFYNEFYNDFHNDTKREVTFIVTKEEHYASPRE